MSCSRQGILNAIEISKNPCLMVKIRFVIIVRWLLKKRRSIIVIFFIPSTVPLKSKLPVALRCVSGATRFASCATHSVRLTEAEMSGIN